MTKRLNSNPGFQKTARGLEHRQRGREKRLRRQMRLVFAGLLGIGCLQLLPQMAAAQSTRQLSILNGDDGFRLAGAAGDEIGFSVSGAGDVNGDGFDDFIVGAKYSSLNGLYSGASYVVFGKASGWPASVDLASLTGTDGFRVPGAAAYDYSGGSVSGAGDINGDGFADLIIGASRADPNGVMSGESYVIFGKASGWQASVDLSSLSGTDGFRLEGAAPYDYSGGSVSGAGDVNGDGFADLIIGANGADPNGPGSGSSYIVFGKASGWPASLNLSSLSGTDGFRVSGTAAYEKSGASVSAAGDVNRDGFADLLIGAFGVDSHGTLSGGAYVVFGKASGWSASLDLSSLTGTNGFRMDGEAANNRTGASVSCAGDVNGDGFSDLIIGGYDASPNASQSGASYVVFGKASGWPASLDLSSLTGSDGFRLTGAAANDYSGKSVSAAGDVNGDGFADLIIGAPSADPNGSESGASYMVFGKASGWPASLALSSLAATDGFCLAGAAEGDKSGCSASSVGDVNGDGFADVIIGAYRSGPNASGSSYVVFGGNGPRATYLGHTPAGNSAKIPVGLAGKNSAPDSRMWLDFDGGTAASLERVTLTRMARTDLRNLNPTADVSRTIWDVHSNREGWTNCVVTLQYTDAEIAGISGGEAGMAIFRAPTPAGPWKRLEGATINAARNQISAPTNRLAFFALASSSVPVTMTEWELE